MYIEPDTNIRILQNVPLDKTYRHTIYFGSRDAQSNYFSSKTKFNLTKQSYQRKERGYMRIQINAEKLYNCNYIMYQNTSFENAKWFYAFITSVEYINNEVSEIGFELDVMQTWFFDVTLKESFVEREHSETDVAGDNIIDEPINLGDYFMGSPKSTGIFDVYDPVIVSPYSWFYNESPVQWKESTTLKKIDGNPTILSHVAFNSTNDSEDVTSGSYFGHALANHPAQSDILAVYLCPHALISYSYIAEPESKHVTNINGECQTLEFNVADSKPNSLVQYTPKNKKLLTYPYNKLVIDTGDGNLHEYAYEFFQPHVGLGGQIIDNVAFQISGFLGLNCCFKCTPKNYKGEVINYTESCLLTDFPNVGFLTDSFKNWFAQNKTRLALQSGASLLGVGSGLGTVLSGSSMLTPKTGVLSATGARKMAKGYEEIGRNGIREISGLISEGFDRTSQRYHVNPGSNDGALEIKMGKKDFKAIQFSINPKDAEVIDNFFNVYGYATKAIKVPNRNVRPHWTYTKTIDCNLIGNAPADDVARICSIYDSGITFWNNANEIGNYSLDNSPQ